MKNRWKIGPESEKFPDPVFASIFHRFFVDLGAILAPKMEPKSKKKALEKSWKMMKEKIAKKRQKTLNINLSSVGTGSALYYGTSVRW